MTMSLQQVQRCRQGKGAGGRGEKADFRGLFGWLLFCSVAGFLCCRACCRASAFLVRVLVITTPSLEQVQGGEEGGEGEGLSGRGRLWGVIWVSAVLQRCRVPVLPLMLSCIRVQVRDLAIMTLSLERKERRGKRETFGVYLVSLGSQTGSGFKSEFPLQAAPQGNGSSITRNNEREKQHTTHMEATGVSGRLGSRDRGFSSPLTLRVRNHGTRFCCGTPPNLFPIQQVVSRNSSSPVLGLASAQGSWGSPSSPGSPPLRLAGFPVQWNSLEFLCCRSYCQTSAFSFVLSWT